MQQGRASAEEAFGAAVAAWRENAGLSQRALARKLADGGVILDASALSRLEQGKRAVRLNEAIAIADALNVELDFLIGGFTEAKSAAAISAKLRGQARWSLNALSEIIEKLGGLRGGVEDLRRSVDELRALRTSGASGFDTLDADIDFEPLFEVGDWAIGLEHSAEQRFALPDGQALLWHLGMPRDTFGPGGPEEEDDGEQER